MTKILLPSYFQQKYSTILGILWVKCTFSLGGVAGALEIPGLSKIVENIVLQQVYRLIASYIEIDCRKYCCYTYR